jgi:hypothetical protein
MPFGVTYVSDYGDSVDKSLRTVMESKLERKMRHRTARSPMRREWSWLIGEEEGAS